MDKINKIKKIIIILIGLLLLPPVNYYIGKINFNLDITQWIIPILIIAIGIMGFFAKKSN